MRPVLKWMLVGLMLAAPIVPTAAQDAASDDAESSAEIAMPPATHLERVPIRELDLDTMDGVVDLIAATAGQEMVRLRVARRTQDCVELTRIANSLALGHEMLGEADMALSTQEVQEAFVLRAKVVQARVLTFSGRYRAAEQLRRCGQMTMDADKLDNPRYAEPAPLATAEFTQAAIDLIEAGEVNLAGAVASGVAQQCGPMRSSRQSIGLFLPYLDELVGLLQSRPLAMGPRANRSQLNQLRARLVEGDRLLAVQIERSCSGDQRAGPTPPEDGDREGGDDDPGVAAPGRGAPT